MPPTTVLFYQESEDDIPVMQWIDRINDMRANANLAAVIDRLAAEGYELRRPQADLLRDHIYELRARSGNVHYRILYFFHEHAAILAHGLTKEGVVPKKDIEIAIARRTKLKLNPTRHIYNPDQEETEDEED
jgi:hypothetical protein